MTNACLCLTPGDPSGIGYEIAAKFLARHRHRYPQARFHLIGSLSALQVEAERLDFKLPRDERLIITNIQAEQPGQVAYDAIERAVQLIVQGQADALVTGPISKHNLRLAGIWASGHTEILEELAHRYFGDETTKAEMLFVYGNFRLMLLTRHIPLAEVPIALHTPQTEIALKTLAHHLKYALGILKPRIAMLGMNPHAGEIGGHEECEILMPLMHRLASKGIAQFEGPFAADGFFRGFNAQQCPYDAVVAIYHDQGLIPFKLIAGYQAVNVTIGLPFIRTSVSHGTAEDIAGKGTASEESLLAAIDEAQRLVSRKALHNPSLTLR